LVFAERNPRFAFVKLVFLVASVALVRPAGATMPALSGTLPEPVTAAFSDGLFGLPERAPGLGVSLAQNRWRVPVILVSFSDAPLQFAPYDFNHSLFDTTGSTATGSVFDYYRWVSGGRFTITGEVVATVQLPNSRSYYGAASWGLNTTNTPRNSLGAFRDAVRICQASVDWSEFDLDRDGYVDMVWLVHSGIGGEASSDRSDLWSVTSRMSVGWRSGGAFTTADPVPGTANQHMLIDRFTILPELSPLGSGAISEIGVFCHEFGHALGLPDLYDTSNSGGPLNVGPGNWSLMSSGPTGATGARPSLPPISGHGRCSSWDGIEPSVPRSTPPWCWSPSTAPEPLWSGPSKASANPSTS
jgi:M6 family metalloprotease-like protein